MKVYGVRPYPGAPVVRAESKEQALHWIETVPYWSPALVVSEQTEWKEESP